MTWAWHHKIKYIRHVTLWMVKCFEKIRNMLVLQIASRTFNSLLAGWRNKIALLRVHINRLKIERPILLCLPVYDSQEMLNDSQMQELYAQAHTYICSDTSTHVHQTTFQSNKYKRWTMWKKRILTHWHRWHRYDICFTMWLNDVE